MIIVTGGAGFIGSRIVKALNAQGRTDIVVVDDLTEGKKALNLVGLQIQDYVDMNDVQTLLEYPSEDIEVVFHEGACSDTMEWNGQYMMKTNYESSKMWLHYCIEEGIPFIYASSAAVYGNNNVFKEDPAYEKPLNVYGYSKKLFDDYVRRLQPEFRTQVVGLRYFNVYGPGEQHKGRMASVPFHHNIQIQETNKVRLFEGSQDYAPGEQRRDFIFVDDVVNVNLWFWKHPEISGIFNCGTGRSQTFNELARSVIAWYKKGEIEYIPFPEHLKKSYQSFTQADISALRNVGYDGPFCTVEQGIQRYLDEMNA